MKKIAKLKICNWSLIVLTVAILISGVQLEATHSEGMTSVWIHIVIGLLFMGMAAYHVFLHFGFSNWFVKFHKLKSQATRIFWWVSVITLITGLIASVHWLIAFNHAPIGGIHGKIGFLMIILSLCHIAKRVGFFKTLSAKSLSAKKC